MKKRTMEKENQAEERRKKIEWVKKRVGKIDRSK